MDIGRCISSLNGEVGGCICVYLECNILLVMC